MLTAPTVLLCTHLCRQLGWRWRWQRWQRQGGGSGTARPLGFLPHWMHTHHSLGDPMHLLKCRGVPKRGAASTSMSLPRSAYYCAPNAHSSAHWVIWEQWERCDALYIAHTPSM